MSEVPVSHLNKIPLSCRPCPYLGLQLTLLCRRAPRWAPQNSGRCLEQDRQGHGASKSCLSTTCHPRFADAGARGSATLAGWQSRAVTHGALSPAPRAVGVRVAETQRRTARVAVRPHPHLQELLKPAQLAPGAAVLLGHFLAEALLKHALPQGLGQLRVKPVQAEHGSWHPGVGGVPGAGQGWDWREAISLSRTTRDRQTESDDGGFVDMG